VGKKLADEVQCAAQVDADNKVQIVQGDGLAIAIEHLNGHQQVFDLIAGLLTSSGLPTPAAETTPPNGCLVSFVHATTALTQVAMD
jgi:hypothetical protein